MTQVCPEEAHERVRQLIPKVKLGTDDFTPSAFDVLLEMQAHNLTTLCKWPRNFQNFHLEADLGIRKTIELQRKLFNECLLELLHNGLP
jgi:hypothetical protein